MNPATKNALKAWALGVLLLVIVVCGIRLIVVASGRLALASLSATRRSASLIESLPLLAGTSGPVAVVIGTSATQRDFSPTVFDTRSQELGFSVTSFNLGMPGMRAMYFDVLAERLAAAFTQRGKRIELSVLEFSPGLSSTQVEANMGAAGALEAATANIMSARQFARLLAQAPARGFHFLALYSTGLSPADMGKNLEGLVFNHGPKWWPVRQAFVDETEIANAYFKIWDTAVRAAEAEGVALGTFSMSRRGEEKLDGPHTHDAFMELSRLLHSPAFVRQAIERFNRNVDLNIVIHDAELDRLVAVTEQLKRVSNKVVIVTMPHNHHHIRYTPSGQANVDAATQRLQKAAGVPVLDYLNSSAFTAEHFDDMAHLSENGGREVFSRELATQLAPWLSGAAELPPIRTFR